MFYRYGVVAIKQATNAAGLMGVAHTPEEAEEIKRSVIEAGAWRDVEVCDGLDELAGYATRHKKKDVK